MKAAILKENEKITYADIEEPNVQLGCVKIKVAVCGLCGSDIARILENKAKSYPLVLGHEFAGEIVEVAKDVVGLDVGNRVVVAPLISCGKCEDCYDGNFSLCKFYSFIGSRQQGGFAEYVVVPAKNAVKISDEIDFYSAATIEPATVALHGIKSTNFTKGSHVTVIGCGIIGIYTIQWLKRLGATSILVIARGEKGQEAARLAGADRVISTNQEDITKKETWFNYIGADIVYDCVAAEETISAALELVNNKGEICFIGTPKQPINISVSTWENINRKECTITGSWMSYSEPFPGGEWIEAIAAMEQSGIRLIPEMLHGIFDLTEISDLIQQVKEKKTSGRILFRVNPLITKMR